MDISRLKKDQKEFNDITNGRTNKKDFAMVKEIKTGSNLLRFIGPTDYVTCYRSWILCDDGMKRPFILEDQDGNQSILLKMLGDRENYHAGGILESVKDDITGKKKYIYEETHPDIITKVVYNGDRKSVNTWSPSRNAIFNVLDRDLTEIDGGEFIDWCKVNKHFKLLWVKPSAFITYATMVSNDGNPEDYDANYNKSGSGIKTTHIIQRAGNAVSGVVLGPLTDEEKSYKKYDLKKEGGLTPATYILYYLEKSIIEIDGILGTNYLQELKDQSEIEREEFIENNSTQNEKTEVVVTSQQNIEPSQNNSNIEQSIPPVTSEVKESQQISVRQAPPAIPNNETGNIIKCGYCQHDILDTDKICTNCNKPLVAPCDVCKKNFSVFVFECPQCGQVYPKPKN